MVNIGGGGGSDYEVVQPTYRETPKSAFSWMAPGQDITNQLGREVTESLGYNFGKRNLFGSGIQGQATMEELIRQLIGRTQLVNRGQWINPQVASVTNPSWSLGLGTQGPSMGGNG